MTRPSSVLDGIEAWLTVDPGITIVCWSDSQYHACGCYRSEGRNADGWAHLRLVTCPQHRWEVCVATWPYYGPNTKFYGEDFTLTLAN